MSGAVVGGEISERPHGVALHVIVGSERVEVERHLIPVQLLHGLTGFNRDELREM